MLWGELTPTVGASIVHMTPLSGLSVGSPMFGLGAPASTTWPIANEAIYLPFRLSVPFTTATAFVGNGAVAAGNVDLGVYGLDPSGLLVRVGSTGSTAQSGTSALQSIALAITLGAGVYYLALAGSLVTTTVLAWTITADKGRLMGMGVTTLALPLPATATMATNTALLLPVCGFTGRSVL